MHDEIDDLRKRVSRLEKRLDTPFDDVDRSWIWDESEVRAAAKCLSHSFDWEECPYSPNSFREWEDLVEWLENIGEGHD